MRILRYFWCKIFIIYRWTKFLAIVSWFHSINENTSICVRRTCALLACIEKGHTWITASGTQNQSGCQDNPGKRYNADMPITRINTLHVRPTLFQKDNSCPNLIWAVPLTKQKHLNRHNQNQDLFYQLSLSSVAGTNASHNCTSSKPLSQAAGWSKRHFSSSGLGFLPTYRNAFVGSWLMSALSNMKWVWREGSVSNMKWVWSELKPGGVPFMMGGWKPSWNSKT